jgi:hypothetical protein
LATKHFRRGVKNARRLRYSIPSRSSRVFHDQFALPGGGVVHFPVAGAMEGRLGHSPRDGA